MMHIHVFLRVMVSHFRPVEADSGAIGGSGTHEFMAIAEAGEADIVYCTNVTMLQILKLVNLVL